MGDRSPRTVLIVEDDAYLSNLIADLLETEGYVVVQAADADGALELAQRHVPDVILLDLAMPRRSGLDVLHELRNATPTCDIPVLIVSGYALVLMDGAPRIDGVIQKPFDVDALLAHVNNAASGRTQSAR